MAEGNSTTNVLPVPPRSQIRSSQELSSSEFRYDITTTELQQLMEHRPYQEARNVIQRHYGGVSGICKRLCTSPNKGISGLPEDIDHRQKEFGINTVPNRSTNTDPFPVMRGGTRCSIPVCDIVVGDVCEVKKGDIVPADGLIIHCDDMKVDESELTGEVEGVLKGDIVPADGLIIHCDDMKVDESELTGEVEGVLKGEENCPLLLSGTNVIQGTGTMLVVAVGISGLPEDIDHRQKEFGINTVPNRSTNTDPFPVMRGGTRCSIPVCDIVVGDVCEVKKGDIVPADGLIIHCDDMKVDESELTGEVEGVLKGEENCPLLLSGTNVIQGTGTMLVVAVGTHAQKDITFHLDN